jgi:hypothetical protein
VAALTVAVSDRAFAGGVMYSAPISDDAIYCDIRNAGTSEIAGTIETVNYSGTTTSGPQDFTLAPGVGTFHFSPGGGSSCKVTLTKGSPKKVRGVALYNYAEPGAYVVPIQ